ncbi:hypothetical protein BJY00DRAFT_309697 [Aspergillus carlsbadensis]|nr:hypothetical protein BJY00DRAFT_309697 [Aspergillus carlsbadensis]
MSTKTFQYIYHNVVFGPKLPLEPENEQKSLEKELLLLVENVLDSFVSQRPEDARIKWKPAMSMVKSWLTVDATGHTLNRHEEALARALKNIRTHGAIALHVSAQNCGWMAYYDEAKEQIIVDAFEASATTAAVLEAQGPLRRCFPGQSVAIPADTIDNPQFCEYLAHSLCRLDLEVVREMCPKASESREFIEEDWDTVHPGLITEKLMMELLALGKHNAWKSFEKHTRDEVNFEKGRLPWRRSPLWFVLKVALQTTLYRSFPDSEGRAEYKNLMLFLVAEIGSSAIASKVPDSAEVLTIIRAKASRRVYKLQNKAFDFVLETVKEVDAAIAACLTKQFCRIEAADSKEISQKFDSIKESDLETSLKHSGDSLRNALVHTPSTGPAKSFKIKHKKRKQTLTSGLFKLDDGEVVSLVDLETWVATTLQNWHNNTPAADKTCRELAELIEKYSDYATKQYSEVPELMSLMLLVILELWVSLDKMCISICSFLADFSPELPKNLLQVLLLPRRSEMERAQAVEQYIVTRRQHSKSNVSIFDDPMPHTFATRFYQAYQICQKRRANIVKYAEHEREDRRKLQENLSQKHEDLLHRASALSHETENDEFDDEIHLPYCKKCRLEREAANISIEVHEWPLPDDEDDIKNVVFELECPQWFAKWRDVTWMILDDYGRPQTREPSHMEMDLLDYPALKAFHSYRAQRLTLASTTKSWLNTHYSTQSFPVGFEKIALPNALRFSLWDSKNKSWVADRRKLAKPTFKHLCTFTFNAAAYSGLQFALDTCQHEQNKVIAEQRNFQSQLNPHNMVAVGQLRSGERLQWYNIVRELASSSISMNEKSVCDLFCQAAWQLGSYSPETYLRKAHVFFKSSDSVRMLWEALEHRLDSISSNWNEHHTLHTLVVLGLRSLSLGPASSSRRAADFLRKCREVATQWVARLRKSPATNVGNDGPGQLMLMLRIGSICLLTYSTDHDNLGVLLQTDEDLQILVESSMLIFNNATHATGTISPESKATTLLASRVLCQTEHLIVHLIRTKPSGLTSAILQSAQNLHISSPWKFLDGNNTRWVTNTSSSDSDQAQQEIHYNILTGELRIDNEPLARLPEVYTRNASFQRLFGSQPLAVIRSDLTGSAYMSVQPFGEYHVHFRIHDNQLIMKATEKNKTKGTRQILRYIPPDSLFKDFPNSLVAGHAHWINLDDGSLEFRPLQQIWKRDPENWCTFYKGHIRAPSTTMQGQRTLVDIHSEFFSDITAVLGRLDSAEHIVVTKSPDGLVEAKLVRLHLTFFVNANGDLECREHSSVVDSSQNIGCLYGLAKKLVLRDKTRQQRIVLIPYGAARITKETSYSKVTLELPNTPRIKYFSYVADTDLGMLSDTSGMVGSLYLAYLLAITSFVLPDPATNRTGTEEALRILQQARMQSSFPLDGECIHLLELIAALTPYRKYYPMKTKEEQRVLSVQEVKWIQQLSAMAQHDDFRLLAHRIFHHASKFSSFHGRKMAMPPGLLRGDIQLLDRALYRNMQFHRAEFGGASRADCPAPLDYLARDRVEPESDRSRRVYKMATLIRDWPTTLNHKENLMAIIKNWGVMKLAVHPPEGYTYTALLENPVENLWASLYNQCQSIAGEVDKYKLMSVFCTTAFGESEIEHLHPLLAIAVSGGFPEIPEQLVEQSVELKLQPGQAIDKSQIREVISIHYPPLERSSHKGKNLTRNEKGKITRERRKDYNRERAIELAALEEKICRQWPCEVLERPSSLKSWQSASYHDCDALFQRFSRNVQFYEFVQRVQDKLDAINTAPHPQPQQPVLPPRPLIHPRSIVPWYRPRLQDIVCSADAPTPMDTDNSLAKYQRPEEPAISDTHLSEDLGSLIAGLSDGRKPLRTKYATHLSESLKSLQEMKLPCAPADFPVDRVTLVGYYRTLSQQRDNLWNDIVAALRPEEDDWREVGGFTLWPSITVLSMLSLLAADKWKSVPEPWKEVLLMFAKALATLRRCERLISHFDKEDLNGFYKEAETLGCDGWNPAEIPEWLLFEIESNLTIRARQADVAHKMVGDQTNTVPQLNMGEGKTTVITPLIALRLSNGSEIPRIVVLKPLLRQSVNLLSQQLGGLLNRPVYHIPFSRETRVGVTTASTLQEIYDECRQRSGILIVLPEQLLSFRLVGLDLADNEPTVAHELIELEQGQQETCRTIIDESDEVLDPKFQLVYTRGHQQNMDGESDRWEVVQHVLREVEKQALILRDEEQSGLEIDQTGTRYPILRFLKSSAASLLLEKVLDAIGNGAVPGLSFSQFTTPVSESIMKFICCKEVEDNGEDTVRRVFEGSLVLKRLLVLRGLFAYNVLHFVLAGKRWLVDYGIHPTRCLVAVPFRAKGVPSDNATFGHPEVALALTCLSYYYEGLSQDQVRECVLLLAKEDDPGAEYDRWTAQCRDQLPPGLDSFTGVNLDDAHGFKQDLYPLLQYSKDTINFYLPRVVFPREAKEFPFKLSTSAWDIPSRAGCPITSGFSGTNDNRYLLPKTIAQRDLPDLLHTNAMVLSRLLREENRQCILAEGEDGQQLSVEELLRLTSNQRPAIQVLIDVGAQILESRNKEVAKEWLSMASTDRAAAVFFDEEDEAMVIDRDGHTERLFASPFSKQMHRCLVFLDQHHSRGVDLKLPSDYRAAVTLGPRLTKDRLVQACHRMRELGNGQSVVFLIPPEVKHSMNAGKTTFTSFDVLRWVLEQTCDQLERLQPLWATQGLNHLRVMKIWNALNLEEGNLPAAVGRIQEPESKTLLQLYAPWEEGRHAIADIQELASSDMMAHELYEVSGHSESGGTQLHEEQEREIEQEVQKEQQVCPPTAVEPLPNRVHSHIKYFIKNAHFPGPISESVEPAYRCFETTSAEKFDIPDSILDGIFVSADFCETIDSNPDVDDEFLKPVNWVLSNVLNSKLIIISQFEANEFLPLIRESEKTTLHMYAPRTMKGMRSFSKLDFLSIGANRDGHEFSPDILRALELFAGSLYFDKYEEYKNAQSFFGLRTAGSPAIPEDAVTSEGFVAEHARNQVGWPVASPFKKCPLPFLNTWFSIRTKGHAFSKSHMGSIIEAKPLTEEQFEGS